MRKFSMLLLNSILCFFILANKLNINYQQKEMIKHLFGDVAVQTFNDRIQGLEESLEMRTREIIEIKDEFKTFMCSYLDEIQRFEGPKVLVSTIKNKLASYKVRYNPKILQECLTESTNDSDYVKIKIDILNRLQELDEDTSLKEGLGSQKNANNEKYKKEIDDEMDTFMMEIEHMENMNIKNPVKKQEIRESN